jgi:hypothetical protein
MILYLSELKSLLDNRRVFAEEQGFGSSTAVRAPTPDRWFLRSPAPAPFIAACASISAWPLWLAILLASMCARTVGQNVLPGCPERLAGP